MHDVYSSFEKKLGRKVFINGFKSVIYTTRRSSRTGCPTPFGTGVVVGIGLYRG
jgi:hypothetical protein